MRRCRGICLLALAFLAGCGAVEPGSVRPADLPDPTRLVRTGWPNDWLVCPAGACAAEASSPAPTYAVPPERLFAAWREVLATRPRVALIGVDYSRLLILAQDRTPLLRFVDTVSIRVLPDGGSATFAAYSRSNLEFGDLGTNRRRLDEWIGQLAVAAHGG